MMAPVEILERPDPKPQRPVSRSLLGLSLVLPTAETSVPDKAWPLIALAMVLDHEAQFDHARALLRRLEDRLGTNDAHRRAAASSVEDVVEEIGRGKATVALEQACRVAVIGAPLRDPDIVAEIEEARAGAADARAEAAQLRDEDPKRHRKKIKNLEAIARSLDAKAEAARLRELEENRKMGAARETVLRARARGQEVKVEEVETATVVRDEHGARVTHKRGSKRGEPVLKYELISRPEIVTAIMHALDAGKLDNPRTGQGGDGLKKIADQYAEMAAASNHLRCVDPEATGGGGGTGGGPQIKTTEANQWLEIARRRLTVRQRLVLDKVCIEDKLIWTVAKEMKAGRPSIARALRGGLVQVVRNHKSAAEEARRRGLVSSAQKVKIGAEIVRLVR